MHSKSHNSDPFTEFAALYPYIRCTQIEARLLALRLPSQRFTDRTMASGHTMTHLVAPMHASTLGRCISVLHGCHTAMGGVIRCCGRTAEGNPDEQDGTFCPCCPPDRRFRVGRGCCSRYLVLGHCRRSRRSRDRHHRWLWNLLHDIEVDPSGPQPRTGKSVGTSASTKPSFKADKTLCDAVNWLVPDPNDNAARKS